MNQLLTTVSTGLTAFTATNMDDILILLLLFSQANAVFRSRQIVAGQYLGFGCLVLASLPGFFGGLLLPRPWIGLLGIIPIAIGVSRFLNPDEDNEPEVTLEEQPQDWFSSVISPQTYSVAALTFANGGDNIGIYVPLFAHHSWGELTITLGTFFSLVGVWCYTAYRLTRLPAIAQTLTHYGNQLVPFVLMALGLLILIDSHTLENRGLMLLTLILCGFCLIAFHRPETSTATTDNEEN